MRGILLVAVIAVLALAPATSVAAQQAGAPSSGTVERTVTTIGGNMVVVEKLVVDGKVVHIKVTVTSPGGRVVGKAEARLDPNTGTVLEGEAKINAVVSDVQHVIEVLRQSGIDVGTVSTSISGAETVKMEVKVENGVVTKIEQKVILIENGRRVEVEREFRLVNSVLTLVREKREYDEAEEQSGGNTSTGGSQHNHHGDHKDQGKDHDQKKGHDHDEDEGED